MNRSALTIKMLNYLKAHDLVSREELAQFLETNIRNISEFKKELETAGYSIDSVSGKYGGYRLDERSLIPTIALDDGELKALNEVHKYLKVQNFTYLKDFETALMKVKGNLHDPTKSNEVYYLNGSIAITSISQQMSELMEQAKQQQRCILMEYKKLNGELWEERLVQPYEFIHTEDGYYVLAYDITPKKKRMYKHFKLSETRMQKVRVSQQRFTRDVDFKIQNYIGKQGLMQEVFEVQLEIYGKHAALLNEKQIGLIAKKVYKDDILYLEFTSENKMRIVEFILSLGKECKIIRPESLKMEIIHNLQESLNQYML